MNVVGATVLRASKKLRNAPQPIGRYAQIASPIRNGPRTARTCGRLGGVGRPLRE
jgi:hypothetical protein